MSPVTSLDLFYPIVPDVGWLKRIAPLGIKTVQLRLKDADEREVCRQIKESLQLARSHDFQLIINDYWEAAIEEGADYVHLGQEDLANADLAAIKRAGLRLGVSTHDEAELERALGAEPDYVALGPIYETTLKVMKWAPQGVGRVTQWKKRIGNVPLVAIGGITPERAPLVVAAGADSIAVITDFLIHGEPEKRVAEWVSWAKAASRKSA